MHALIAVMVIPLRYTYMYWIGSVAYSSPTPSPSNSNNNIKFNFGSPKVVTLAIGPYLSASWWKIKSSPALVEPRIKSNREPTIGRPLGPISKRHTCRRGAWLSNRQGCTWYFREWFEGLGLAIACIATLRQRSKKTPAVAERNVRHQFLQSLHMPYKEVMNTTINC